MKRAVLGTLVAVMAAMGGGWLAAPALAANGPCCVQHLHFAAGPYYVRPGANSILLDFNHVPKPSVDGYMTSVAPNLHYALGQPGAHMHCCGAIPRVDILHLHHGVWLSNGVAGEGEGNAQVGGFYPFMATGEEKTRTIFPAGFGYPVGAKDTWIFNYMIHDLIPTPGWVYVTYDMTFVPATSPKAKTITPVHPIWMDVMSKHIYPVFDVHRFSGKHGIFTFPYMAKDPYPGGTPPLNQFVVDHPGTLIGTAAHVHPGGLYGQLDLTRAGDKAHGGALPGLAPSSVRLFRSYAHYWDPRGPVSWDMAMKGTAPDWRPYLKAGDVLSVSATYDSRRASWYESMGIMVAWEAWARTKGAVDPFGHKLDQTGYLTHGRLRENRHHGGGPWLTINLKKVRSCSPTQVSISKFAYKPGGLDGGVAGNCIPTVTQGHSLTFHNLDATDWGTELNIISPDPQYVTSIFHTVTSCQFPCSRDTGISYPLANGVGNYDSGQLGFGTPAVNSLTWNTPKGLKPGLYTYFCRIHPFMRGAFRVVG
jgi:hypothetical protein